MSIEAAALGRLTRDGELKISAKGKAYLRLNIATGEAAATTFISITAFDPNAVTNADKFVKGSAVYVEGKLSLDEWVTPDGTHRHGLSILSWHVRLAAKRKKREPDQADAQEPTLVPAGSIGVPYDDPIPFAPEVRG